MMTLFQAADVILDQMCPYDMVSVAQFHRLAADARGVDPRAGRAATRTVVDVLVNEGFLDLSRDGSGQPAVVRTGKLAT